MKHRMQLLAACCVGLSSMPLYAAGDMDTSANHSMYGERGSMRMGHASSMSSQTVRDVQEALADKGFDPGPIDGILGPRTRAALHDYQRSNNLSMTRDPDQQTLDALGVRGNVASTKSDYPTQGGNSASPPPSELGRAEPADGMRRGAFPSAGGNSAKRSTAGGSDQVAGDQGAPAPSKVLPSAGGNSADPVKTPNTAGG